MKVKKLSCSFLIIKEMITQKILSWRPILRVETVSRNMALFNNSLLKKKTVILTFNFVVDLTVTKFSRYIFVALWTTMATSVYTWTIFHQLQCTQFSPSYMYVYYSCYYMLKWVYIWSWSWLVHVNLQHGLLYTNIASIIIRINSTKL